MIEDYHPLDVECAAAGLCLLRAVRERYPYADVPARWRRRRREPQVVSARRLRPDAFERARATRSSIRRVGASTRSSTASSIPAGCRADTCARVRRLRRAASTAFSPFTTRPVIARALEIPFDAVVEGSPERLVVAQTGRGGPWHQVRARRRDAGRTRSDGSRTARRARRALAVDQGVVPARRSTGCGSERLRAAEGIEWRSGNEMPSDAGSHAYPAVCRRDRWVLARRGAKAALDPARAVRLRSGRTSVTRPARSCRRRCLPHQRECPFRCVMCDLWMQHARRHRSPQATIPEQIRRALAALPPVRQVKLYNAGSFFDPAAIPVEDDSRSPRLVGGLDRVIVEAHPAFLRGAAWRSVPPLPRCIERPAGSGHRARDGAPGRAGAAQQADDARLVRDAAADFLVRHDIDSARVRAAQARRSCRRTKVSHGRADRSTWPASAGPPPAPSFPTRRGNGALEAIGEPGSPPSLRRARARGRVRPVARRLSRVRRPVGHRALLQLRVLVQRTCRTAAADEP